MGFFQDEKRNVVDVQNILYLYGLLHIYQMLPRRNVRGHPANFLSTHISSDAATDRSVVSARRLCRTITTALSVSKGEYGVAHAGTTNDGACMPAGALAGWLANEPDHPIDAPDREWLDQMVVWLSEAFVSSTWVWSRLHAHQRKLSAALAVRANFELRSTLTRLLPGSWRQHATPYAVCSKSEMFHFYVKLPRSLLRQSSPAPPSR